nr:uncharacterized mitochondrial protein AtMg00810-like [Tanacetum cinerariifolium]
MESLSPQVVSASKLPILKPNEFDLWKIRIEQYFLMTDYSLWEVILNGDSPTPTRVLMVFFSQLLLLLLNKEAIEKRFRGNTETKKVQKTLLKQQYKNFTGSSSESLDQIHDRLQKLINLKEQSLDDLFNNLNIYEAKVKSSSSASTSTQNITFVSTSNTDSTNEPVSAAASVFAVSAKISVFSLPNVDSLSGVLQLPHEGTFARECRSPTDTRRNAMTGVFKHKRNLPTMLLWLSLLQVLLSTMRKSSSHEADWRCRGHFMKIDCIKAEAVNTACYVYNRVLVTKPQNKTPYELLHGRTPSIGFIRPFGCLVTILNTLHSLGKFNRKVDEGFLVGYSVSSKAYRIFNSRTRIVQETLHVNFLENKPNVASSGPTWLFDIDNLTKTMNYQPVTAGNQSNPSAGVQDKFDVEKAGEESLQQYVLFPVWSSSFTNLQNTDGDATFDEKELEFKGRKPESKVNVSSSNSAQSKKHDDKTKREAKGKIPAIGQISSISTNTFSAAGPSNAADSPTHGKSSCIDTSQYPDDPNMPELEDITYSDDEDDVGAEADFNNLEISITVSPIPTTRVYKDHPVTQIIDDLSLATQTRSMKRVARDQGHIQEEGIDYEEVFAPVARIEAIRLFLAYASFMGFMVYQMDGKSAFLYRTIKKEVYVCQPLRFENPDNPDKVYKVVKALYGLHQAPRAWKFGLRDGKSANTPIDTEKTLLKDPKGEDVDMHTYRLMIGSLIYLTSSRPDIMFAVCACARFQVTPKALHLHALKRIFRYLKGKPFLGLWYRKDSPFDLAAYSDSDYAGASLDRKSTTGECQFLGCRLISWQCKKQTVVNTLSTVAEYVAAVSCCTQVLWIQNQLMDY